jgi:hypothetical protein
LKVGEGARIIPYLDAATIIEEVKHLSPEERSLVIDALLSCGDERILSPLEVEHVVTVEMRHQDFLRGEATMEDAFQSLQSVREKLHAIAR